MGHMIILMIWTSLQLMQDLYLITDQLQVNMRSMKRMFFSFGINQAFELVDGKSIKLDPTKL